MFVEWVSVVCLDIVLVNGLAGVGQARYIFLPTTPRYVLLGYTLHMKLKGFIFQCDGRYTVDKVFQVGCKTFLVSPPKIKPGHRFGWCRVHYGLYLNNDWAMPLWTFWRYLDDENARSGLYPFRQRALRNDGLFLALLRMTRFWSDAHSSTKSPSRLLLL